MEDYLSRHLNLMHKPLTKTKCEVCQEEFSTTVGRNRHHRTVHEDVRNFRCNQCEKCFKRPAHLASHVKSIHVEERPWKCKECDFSSRREDTLKLHSAIHRGTRDRSHQCDLCPQSFYRRSTLTNHIRIHTGDRPHHCNLCKSSYKTSGDLSSHQRVHFEKDRWTFPCVECDKSFTSKSSLKRHSLQHTGESPFKCKFCEKRFKQGVHARVHEKSVHKEQGD